MWGEWAVRLDDCPAKCTETVSGWYLYHMLRCVHETKKTLIWAKSVSLVFLSSMISSAF